MNSALRQSWAHALRSGKYAQGKGQLRSRDLRYCAMGVLYDLICSNVARYQPWGSLLPDPILNHIGLSAMAQARVAQLNDSGLSFEQIADIIDRDADLETELKDSVDREILRIQVTSHSFVPKLLVPNKPLVYFDTAF